jgi:hypothetical protein
MDELEKLDLRSLDIAEDKKQELLRRNRTDGEHEIVGAVI